MSETTETKACEAYNESTADIIFVSNDNVRFRVHSYVLKNMSTVFRDMLNATPLSNDAEKPIELNAPTSTAQLFFDLMQHENPTNTVVWEDAKQVHLLCEKYACPIVSERVRNRLHPVVASAPWDILVIASHANDVLLAKAAIAVMSQDPNVRPATHLTLSVAMAAQLSTPYLMGLLRTMMTYYQQGYSTDWAHVASGFQPAL